MSAMMAAVNAATNDTDDPHGTRGWWINERRIELGMDWDDLAAAVGVSRQALFNIRKGGGLRSKNRRNLEAALQWEPGSLAEIDKGGKPTPLPITEPGYPPDRFTHELRGVAAAREAMGHKYRPSLVKEVGISPRSLEAVEQAESIEDGPIPPTALDPPTEPEESTPVRDDDAELDELRALAAALRAQSTEALQLAARLTDQIDRLDRSGDHRAQG